MSSKLRSVFVKAIGSHHALESGRHLPWRREATAGVATTSGSGGVKKVVGAVVVAAVAAPALDAGGDARKLTLMASRRYGSGRKDPLNVSAGHTTPAT